MYLANSGFEILPKNYSQAAVLTKAKKLETGYYQDYPMLKQIWGTLVANTVAEKITANAIEKAIDPDYEEKQSLRLPKRLLEWPLSMYIYLMHLYYTRLIFQQLNLKNKSILAFYTRFYKIYLF